MSKKKHLEVEISPYTGEDVTDLPALEAGNAVGPITRVEWEVEVPESGYATVATFDDEADARTYWAENGGSLMRVERDTWVLDTDWKALKNG